MENQTLVWILVVLVLLFGVVNIYFAATAGKPDLSGLATNDQLNTAINTAISGLVTKQEITNLATKEDLASITPVVPVIPEIPEVKVEGDIVNKVAKLCELTQGCERWDMDDEATNILIEEIEDREYRKLRKGIEEITGIDRDDYELFETIVKDQIAYATDEEEADDGNYIAELFLRVKYNDEDEGDNEIVYLHVIGTVEDDIDVDITSITKVDRNFELE